MIKNNKYRLYLLKLINPFMHGVKLLFVFVFILTVASMMLDLILPAFYKIFIDRVIIGGETNQLLFVIAGYLSVFLLGRLIGYIIAVSKNKITNRVTFRAKARIWTNIFSYKLKYYESADVGQFVQRLENDTKTISAILDDQSIGYIISLLTILISGVIMFNQNWILSLIVIIVIPITYYLDNFIAKKELKLNDANRDNDVSMTSWLHQTIQSWKEVKTLGIQRYSERKFISFLHKYAIYYGKWINLWVIRGLLIPKIKDEFFIQFVLYFVGSLLIYNGKFSVGGLLIFSQYYNILSGAIKTLSNTDAELVSNKPFIDKMTDAMKKVSYSTSSQSIALPDNADITIEFRGVSFSYPNSQKIIDNFNLKVEPGDKVAVIGKSGCGKSTLLKLLVGLEEPDEGEILFSGYNICDISEKSLFNYISILNNKCYLFNDTIRNNLLMAKPDASEEELISACRESYALDYIMQTTNKFDTVIGENGSGLSGGERQRLLLARALLRNKQILLMDEAISAVDMETDDLINKHILSESREKTVVSVSHRESITTYASHIIKL